jgi:multiple sugar transport system substrate-binding protein
VCDFLEIVWGHGGQVIDAEGKVRLDGPEAVEALTWMVDTVHKHKISPKGVLTYQEEEARNMFQEGKAVFMRNWPYAWNLVQAENSPVAGKVGIMPMVHGKKGVGAATLGGWGYGISAFSKHPEAAWAFAQFATNAESQKLNYHRGGIIPTRKALFKDSDVLKKSPHFSELYEVLEKARPRPVHRSYARISDTLQGHLSSALAGDESPEAALKSAASEIRSFVEK